MCVCGDQLQTDMCAKVLKDGPMARILRWVWTFDTYDALTYVPENNVPVVEKPVLTCLQTCRRVCA